VRQRRPRARERSEWAQNTLRGGGTAQTRQASVTDAQADERAVRQLVDEWLTASEKGDLTAMLNLLAEDVLFMVPNKEPFGREKFAQAYEEMRNIEMKTSSDIQEIKVIGDWAWMRNFLRVTFTSSDGHSTLHSGHVLTILRKNSNGNWLIVRDANLLMPEGSGGR
jgi:uncharacterized protein (TIGR02246 family)